MQVLRLNEVLMRVVAWHNRHPLARRIHASQVHSIGEVLLPFAACEPAMTPVVPPAASHLPDVADLLDPPQADMPLLPDGMCDVAAPARAAAGDAGLASNLAAEAPDPISRATNAGSSPFTLAEADLAAQRAADLSDVAPAAAEALDLALPLAPQATREPPAPAPQAAPAATAAAMAPGRLRRLRAWLTGRQPGMPQLRPAFSQDFIWPMSPRRVARWARGHGQLQALAPADWPRRIVETDGMLLGAARQQGLTHAVELHVLTAAIGVGDRRLRVLMDAQGAVIGPRAYSRPRLAAAGGLLAAALLGLGWTPLRLLLPDKSTLLSEAAATSAPAMLAPAAASADLAALTEPAASAASSAAVATTAASPSGAAASNTLPSLAASPASPDATVPAVQLAEAPAARPAAAEPPAAAVIPPAAAAPPATGLAAEASAGNPAPLGRIRPALSDRDKQAARAQTAALRGDQAEAPPAATAATAAKASHAVYAVVTRPSPRREVASAGLAVINRASNRLPAPVPEHGELMQNQGAWRAAWWPFASLADAERARVLLAGKGLKVEVVEF